MAKVCEMIVNRDYIRENNAGHPPRLIPLRRVRLRRARSRARERTDGRTHARTHARGGVRTPLASAYVYVCVCMYACVSAAHVCACVGAMLSRTCVEKKAAWRAGRRGREDVDIFLRATRECRERHAFDWPGVVGAMAGEQGAG